MTKRYTRRELYDLVWSEPMTSLALKIKISTTTIRKGCHGLQVPIPPQGHWLRKAHNKPLEILPLPKRGPGVADHIEFGVDPFRHYYWHQFSEAELMGPEPIKPVFDEPLEAVQQQVEAAFKKLVIAKTFTHPHPAVGKLLRWDEDRRKKAEGRSYIFDWDKPHYTSPIQQRRLKIVSSIMLTAAAFGCGGDINDGPSRVVNSFVLKVGHQPVRFQAEVFEETEKTGKGADAKVKKTDQIRIYLGNRTENPEAVWQDGEIRLEQQCRNIAIAMMVQAERQHRENKQERYDQWFRERDSMLEHRRQQREEAEQKERERLAQLGREQVERLLGEAEAFQKARAIRCYARTKIST